MLANVVNGIIAGAIGLLVLAGVLVGAKAFQTSIVSNTAGCNSTTVEACGAAYNMTRGIGYLSNNFSAQLPVVGTMFGVALILSAIGLLGYGIAMGASKLQ